MCVGIPMRVLRLNDDGSALCARRGHEERSQAEKIDIRLLDQVQEGDWLLTFLGAARAVLSAQDAAQIADALDAVALALSGDGASIDALFADLINREPELPEHLR